MPSRFPKTWFWPLGLLGYGEEIKASFSAEAELLGVMTILWNQHESHLKRIFVMLLAPGFNPYAEAIWNLQPTHQAKRNMLALALEHVDLTERQRVLLDHILEKTKTAADRRNDLIHGEYVVHGNTGQLFAIIQSPRSAKPPRHQKNTAKDLARAVRELEELMQITAALSVELLPADLRASATEAAKKVLRERGAQSPQSPPPD
jgi:hypothetical protein